MDRLKRILWYFFFWNVGFSLLFLLVRNWFLVGGHVGFAFIFSLALWDSKVKKEA